MPVFYNKPFTFFIAAIIIYAFFATNKERNKIIDSQKDADKPVVSQNIFDVEMREFAVKAGEQSTKFLEKPVKSVVDRFKSSEYGKVMLQKAAMNSIREQHGDQELHIIYTRINKKVKAVEILKGAGEASACGDTVKIKYDYLVSQGKDYEDIKSKEGQLTKTIKLGKGEIVKGLENGVSGMKKGSRRNISIPYQYATLLDQYKSQAQNEDFVLAYEVEMLEIVNHIPFDKDDITVIEKIPNPKALDFASCGRVVDIKYTISGKNYNQKDEIKNVSFKIGSGNVPIGLEQGIIEVPVGSTVKIKVPKKLMKTVSGINIIDTLDEDTDFFVELVAVRD